MSADTDSSSPQERGTEMALMESHCSKSMGSFPFVGGGVGRRSNKEDLAPTSLPTLCWAEVTWPLLSEKVSGELCPQRENESAC